MNAAGTPFESQARLWLVAFVASALVNLVVLAVIGFWAIARIAMRPPSRGGEASETVALIVPQVASEASLVPPPPEPAGPLLAAEPPATAEPTEPPEARASGPKPFVRTSADQAAVVPEHPDFIGERNTVATSEGTPQPDAPDLPNQKGREPLSDGEIETTQSNYQDGDLVPSGPDQSGEAEMTVPPGPESSAQAAEPELAAGGSQEQPPQTIEPAVAKERLAEGPVPVDRRVKMEEQEEAPKPASPEREVEGKEAAAGKDKAAEQAKPAASSRKPAFQGNQSKTRLEGSITRVGRSALNVEDSVLGRYHATVSRAVEKAWQLHCVRNRDYITPGQLTLRVMLESSGKVRSMGVVEEIGVGNIQKGFTLNSIHDAQIPAMPAALKKQLDGEPLELILPLQLLILPPILMPLPPILAAAEVSRFQQIWNFFAEGGFCMILLGVCSLIAVAAGLFKLLSLRREFIIPAVLAKKVGDFGRQRGTAGDGLFSEIEEGRSTLARLCRVAVRHKGETRGEITDAVQAAAREEILHLHAGMAVIDATISLAPLLGLLGMASGLVVMFGGLGENPDPTRVSHGISEALNTTVFGLALAVPAIVAHAFFLRRIEMFVARLEVLLADFARACEGPAKAAPPTLPVIPKA